MDKSKLNPHFQTLAVDYLYHLGLDSTMDLKQQFGSVKYVVFTRSFANADNFANQFATAYFNIHGVKISCKTIAKEERYHMYKISNTLIISHGLGFPSMLICLNEVVKLLWHAAATNVEFIRLSAAGGLGTSAESIVIANEAIAPDFSSSWNNIEFGEYYSYPTILEQDLVDRLISGSSHLYQLVHGKVLGGYSFYNGQGRLNGATQVSYSKAERDAYLTKLMELGVKGIDLESSCFAAFCQEFKIPAAMVLAIVTDRLTDNDTEPHPDQDANNLLPNLTNAGKVIINYILSQTKRT